MVDSIVAVYGSLKRGFYNYSFIETAEYLGEYHTEPRYTMVDMGVYPALVSAGDTKILVEAYRVTAPILADLDMLEGVPHFYERGKISLPGYPQVWLYTLSAISVQELGDYTHQIISSGVWQETGFQEDL